MKVILFLILMLPDGGYIRQETAYTGPQTDARCREVGQEYLAMYPGQVRGYICQ